MRPGWKKAGKYAEKPAFEIDQISEAIADATCADWQQEDPAEFVQSVRVVIEGNDLFADQKSIQLENLRLTASGHVFASIFLDCATREVQVGGQKEGLDLRAMMAALAIWIARHGRQIEEHYCRETDERRATDVRGRIEQAIKQIPKEKLANRLLNPIPLSSKGSKHAGLDDGVQL